MNKFINKLGVIVLAIAIVTVCLGCFVACNQPNTDAKTVTITIGETVFSVDTKAAFLHEALLELKADNKIAEYDFADSTYGIFINSLSGLDISGANSFIAIYHNIDDASLIDFSEWAAADITLGETTYKSAYVGVAELPLIDGAKYLLVVSTY